MVQRAWRRGITFLIPDRWAARMRSEGGCTILRAQPGDPDVVEPILLKRALELLELGAPLPIREPRMAPPAAAPASTFVHQTIDAGVVVVIDNGEVVTQASAQALEREDPATRHHKLARDVQERAAKKLATRPAVRSRR